METRTYNKLIKAPPKEVFGYLADIDNFPEWATGFCQKLERKGGVNLVTTPGGQMQVEFRSDPRTGVIDIASGPQGSELTVWPLRVFALPEGRSLFQFTALQGDTPEEIFEQQMDELQREMENVRKILE